MSELGANDLELARLLDDIGQSPDDPVLRRRIGTVTARSGASYTVTVGGSSITGVRALIPLVVGDVVELVFDGPRPIALGHVDTGWHNVGDAGEPAFQNGWQNFGSGWAAARFRKVHGIVYLQGMVVHPGSNVVASTAVTLPAGYRPAAQLAFAANSGNGPAELATRTDVYPSGAVLLGGNISSGASYYSLAGVSFPADQ